jgi:hypothetical protein
LGEFQTKTSSIPVFLAADALPLVKTSATWQQLLLNAVPKYIQRKLQCMFIVLSTNNKTQTKTIKIAEKEEETRVTGQKKKQKF